MKSAEERGQHFAKQSSWALCTDMLGEDSSTLASNEAPGDPTKEESHLNQRYLYDFWYCFLHSHNRF